jgi:hypothetical protein
MVSKDYDTIVKETADIIIEDPTAAKTKFKSPIDLAVEIYVPNMDAIVLKKAEGIIVEALKKSGRLLPFTVQEFRSALKTVVKENNKKLSQEDIVKQVLGSYPLHAGEFMELWAARFGKDYVWNYDDTVSKNGEIVSVDDILTDIRNCENSLKLHYGKDLIVSNLKRFRKKAKQNRIEHFRTVFMPVKDEAILKQFLEACQGFFIDGIKAYHAILEFIRQVKCEIYGFPDKIKYHHFLFIHSKDQGTGKTKFVELLKAPLKDLSASCHLEKLFDPAYISYPSYYLLDFDDIRERLTQWKVSRLKEMITAREVPSRYFFCQDIYQIPRKFHGIATSNCVISDIIDDDQMRRFLDLETKPLPKDPNVYEIGCVNQKEWDLIEAIDYNKLFKAVFYDQDAFLSKHKETVSYENDPLKTIAMISDRWKTA